MVCITFLYCQSCPVEGVLSLRHTPRELISGGPVKPSVEGQPYFRTVKVIVCDLSESGEVRSGFAGVLVSFCYREKI